MYFGVDYYPEHWDVSMIEEDIRRMKEMGVNIVRIGEFAWHLMEREEGEFDFSFFDGVIKKLKEAGIKVMFGTPTATFPAWLAKKHPSILSEDESGVKRAFGGRRQYCFNSHIYYEYSERIVRKLVENYREEEAIIAWQIDNEFGHEGSDFCFCKQCHEKFQKFLERRYENIEELNRRYGTIFWGQTYNDFTEIPIPVKTITTHNPTLQLDWARFRSESINRYASFQVKLVKELRGSHQEVTHNLYGGFFDKCFDQVEHTEKLDFVSYDNYPVWGGLKKPLTPAHIAMTHDYIRGLKGKNYWIVEQLMGAQGHTVIGYLPRPNQAKMWAYQAFAHGCENMLWFRWRGMTRGAEQFCFGIIDHDNKDGRKYREVQSFIEEMKGEEELVRSSIESQVAVVYDFDNIWSWHYQPQSMEFDFTKELVRMYTPFYNHNINIDVISAGGDLSNYKVLVLPVMQIIDETLQTKLDTFVKGGGTVVFSFRAGIKDRDNNINFGETIPCRVREMAGIEVVEIEALQRGQEVEIEGRGIYSGRKGECSVWRDIIQPTTGKLLFGYSDNFFGEMACITENFHGRGRVYYVGGGVDEDTLTLIAKKVLREQEVKVIGGVEGVEIYPRTTKEGTSYFLMNHSEEKKEVGDITLKPYEGRIVKPDNLFS